MVPVWLENKKRVLCYWPGGGAAVTNSIWYPAARVDELWMTLLVLFLSRPLSQTPEMPALARLGHPNQGNHRRPPGAKGGLCRLFNKAPGGLPIWKRVHLYSSLLCMSQLGAQIKEFPCRLS